MTFVCDSCGWVNNDTGKPGPRKCRNCSAAKGEAKDVTILVVHQSAHYSPDYNGRANGRPIVVREDVQTDSRGMPWG